MIFDYFVLVVLELFFELCEFVLVFLYVGFLDGLQLVDDVLLLFLFLLLIVCIIVFVLVDVFGLVVLVIVIAVI